MSKPLRISIVDDHSLFREGLKHMLRSLGFAIHSEAEDGQSFISRLRSWGLPDVVILDVNMPGMDGIETARWLTGHFPELPKLMLSMDISGDTISQALANGAIGYLSKSAGYKEISLAIDAVYGNSPYLDQLSAMTLIRFITERKVPMPVVTEKEKFFLQLICMEFSMKEIAEKMLLSTRTVEAIRARLMEKLDIKGIAGLVVYAIKKGIYQPEGVDYSKINQPIS